MLCDLCVNIDFARYFQKETDLFHSDSYLVRPDETAVCLGSLSSIYDKRDVCGFCRLVISSACKRWSRYERQSPEQLLQRCREQEVGEECYIYSYLYANTDPTFHISETSPVETKTSSTAYRIGIGLRRPQNPIIPYFDHAGDIQLSGTSAPKVGKSDLFFGRVMDRSRVDINLASSWLELCESQHGKKCDAPALDQENALPDSLPSDILMVDVKNMCICYMPPGKRYVALSYCWPEVVREEFLTTRMSILQLLEPGSLKKSMKKLSPVIQDAINFVREFGEHFLWVDVFCVIQDDDTHKLNQIRQMDRVYGGAALTIICAPPPPLPSTGECKSLPGYRSGSRICLQEVEESQGLTLMTPFLGLDLAVMYSRWDQRAWTFQEHRLSRRKLWFTELQLYFQCSCAVFCEDTVGEGCPLTAFIYMHSSLWNSCSIDAPQLQRQNGLSTWRSRSPVPNAVEGMNTYERLFHQYSMREMSHLGDIVFAFQGVLSILKRTCQTEFLAGLPEAYLPEALLWLGTGPHVRRTIPAGDSTMMPYPSWSWAGWASTATYVNIFMGYILSEVEWYIIDDTEVAAKLDTPGTYSPSDHPQLHVDNKRIRPGDPPHHIFMSVKSRGQLQISEGYWDKSQLLACWTTVASFTLTGESFDLEGIGGRNFESHENMIIFDEEGNAAGSIIIEKLWGAEWLRTNSHGDTFEFMMLSRSNVLADLMFFDAAVFPGREWCYVNVMLIQRAERDIASRLGVGVIHEDAWVDARPAPMLVKLE